MSETDKISENSNNVAIMKKSIEENTELLKQILPEIQRGIDIMNSLVISISNLEIRIRDL